MHRAFSLHTSSPPGSISNRLSATADLSIARADLGVTSNGDLYPDELPSNCAKVVSH